MPNNERINPNLVEGLNRMREISSEIYHEYIPIITQNTDIGELARPILEVPQVMNEFVSTLVNRIVYTAFISKYFNSPLKVLEGDEIPLGYAGQEIYVNPAKGRQFNNDDFAGLLFKYEADVKVQYLTVNSDLQYPVTVSRHKLKQAFVSWSDLDRFIGELTNSLYNGAFIDEFMLTKGLISGAFKQNTAPILKVNQINSKEEAENFITSMRSMVLNMKLPSTKYNAWSKIGGYGKPVTTWSEDEDIVFIIRNDVLAYLDVNVMAVAFNMDKTSLLGRIIPVDNFDMYDDDGIKVFDGSNILGFVGDRKWFKIKRQDMFLDEFYNANNRTWQYYLNLTKMYNYSLFANGVIIATELPSIPATGVEFIDVVDNKVEFTRANEIKTIRYQTTPVNATTEFTPELANNYSKIISYTNNAIVIEALQDGDDTLTIKNAEGTITKSITLTNTNQAPKVISAKVTKATK